MGGGTAALGAPSFALASPAEPSGPTPCTAAATCAGSPAGSRPGTRSRASPAAPGPPTWKGSCCSPPPPRSLSARVSSAWAACLSVCLSVHPCPPWASRAASCSVHGSDAPWARGTPARGGFHPIGLLLSPCWGQIPGDRQARPHPRFPPRRAPSPEHPGQVQPLPLQPLPEPGHLPQRPARLLPLRLPRRLQGSTALGSPAGGDTSLRRVGSQHGGSARPQQPGGDRVRCHGPLLAPTAPSVPRAGTARWLSTAAPPNPAPTAAPASPRRGKEPGSGECWMGTLEIWVLGQQHGAVAPQGHVRCFLPISWKPGTSVPLPGTDCSRGTGQDAALVPQPCPCLTLATPNA